MKLGIIGAMDVEVQTLRAEMEIHHKEVIAGQEYDEGTLRGLDVVVIQCGIGIVRAAMAAQILIDHFHVSHIVNTGIAGSLNNDIHIGDFVISKDAVFSDVDATGFGYPIGQIPQLDVRFFNADEQLQKAATEAVRLATPEVRSFNGRIATSDSFISKREQKKWIRDTFQADCTEMEGCAIAECCYLNQIPFVILRAISDQADESVSESYDLFEAKAAAHSAKAMAKMCELLNQ